MNILLKVIVCLSVLITLSCKEEDVGVNAVSVTSVAGKKGDVKISKTDIDGLLLSNGKIDTSLLPTGISSVNQSGDITGTSDVSVISKIQNVTLNITSLTSSDYLKFNGTSWVNSQLPSQSVTLSGDVSGNMSASIVDKIKSVLISFSSLTTGDFLVYNGTAWINQAKTNSVFAGEVITTAAPTCPTGTLLANGAQYTKTTYAELYATIVCTYGCPSGTTFNVPDYRGYFLRMTDIGTANDPDSGTRTAQAAGANTGDNVGSRQASAYGSHSHQTYTGIDNANGGFTGQGGATTAGIWSTGGAGNLTVNQVGSLANTMQVTASGGNETRPRNVYVNYCIRVSSN